MYTISIMNTSAPLRKNIRVGVIRGGPSREYEISLRTGENVLRNLPEGYVPVDIFISKEGEWHMGGKVKTPDKVIPHVDVVFNALHGEYGEDGKVQNFLQKFGVPFTGTRSLSSAFGMNKNISKALFGYHGIKTPEHSVVYPKDNTYKKLISLFQSIPQPSIIKPISGGSSIGINFARDFNSFRTGIESALKHSGAVIVEEYIPGTELTCGVLEGSDGITLFSLPPIAPRKKDSEIFDYDMKYESAEDHISPAPISKAEAELVQKIALAVHRHLGLRHYSAVDFVLHPKKGVYVLEVNTLPGLTKASLFPKALETHGVSMSEFVEHLITLALNKQ